jgi:hypothetical protein
MSYYISSVSITFEPKDDYTTDPLVSTVLLIDFVTGITIPHVTNYINKNPLVRRYLDKYRIINLSFRYSDLS